MPDVPVLDPVEQRILGSLMEKQVTVPASYPLSLNALRTACNQTSSREPVTDYDEQEVERVARGLKDRGLLRIVWSDTGRRTLKYHQTLVETLDLAEDERALLTVLLLRGPQAPGELRTRTERQYAFADREQVEEVLERLAARPEPLVLRLERRPGDRDRRWVHLLGEHEAPTAPAGPVEVEAEVEVGETRDEKVRTSYSGIATAYADHFGDELEHLPFERWLLGRVAEAAREHPVVDVGCGPGHVTAHLAAQGARATGIDLAPAMVEEARRRYPGGRYEVGDLRSLMRPPDADGWGAVLAWYSLVHLTHAELPDAVAALVRPLRPGGRLVLAVHAGQGTRRPDSWFDIGIDMTFVLHDPARVRAAVEGAGLVDVEWYHRGPLAAREETSERFYVLARKPG